MKTKYKVKIFEDDTWITNSTHYNWLPAQCNRDNKRKAGFRAIITFHGKEVDTEVIEKPKEEREGI
jgi:hypothetical protein